MMRHLTLCLALLLSTLSRSQVYLEWAKQLGGVDYERPNSIALGVGGIVHTAGYFQGTADFDPNAGTQNLTPAYSNSLFVSKLANTGTYIWAKQLDGTGYQDVSDLAVDATGNVYVLGSFDDSLDVDPGPGV